MHILYEKNDNFTIFITVYRQGNRMSAFYEVFQNFFYSTYDYQYIKQYLKTLSIMHIGA